MLLKAAFERGVAKLVESDMSLGIMGVGCKIGEGAFYFLPLEDEELSIEQVEEKYTDEMLYEQMAQTIIDLDTDLDEDESTYYIAVLMQGLLKFTIQYEDNSCREFIVSKEWFNRLWNIEGNYDLSDVFCRAVLDSELIGEVHYE